MQVQRAKNNVPSDDSLLGSSDEDTEDDEGDMEEDDEDMEDDDEDTEDGDELKRQSTTHNLTAVAGGGVPQQNLRLSHYNMISGSRGSALR